MCGVGRGSAATPGLSPARRLRTYLRASTLVNSFPPLDQRFVSLALIYIYIILYTIFSLNTYIYIIHILCARRCASSACIFNGLLIRSKLRTIFGRLTVSRARPPRSRLHPHWHPFLRVDDDPRFFGSLTSPTDPRSSSPSPSPDRRRRRRHRWISEIAKIDESRDLPGRRRVIY